MARIDLSFVLPAYNEGESIEGCLDSLDRVVKDVGLRYEIVVVDDGSRDGTRLKAARFARRNGSGNGHVRVVSYERNEGKGYAVRKGFLESAGEAVVFVDSDLEIGLDGVSRYVEALRFCDIVIGSKWHPESIVDVSMARRFLGVGFNVFVRLLTGVRLRDTQTGLKAIRREAFLEVFPRLAVKRYAFDVELLAVANLLGLRVVEMPVKLRLQNLFSIREVWRMLLDLLGIAYRLRVTRAYSQSIVDH